MISYISGIYAGHSTDAVVIECGGIGFCIRVPETVLNRLPAKNSEFKLYTYLHVKEDAMQLYGFISKEEQEMFELLIGVSGIGPKGALGILSALSMDTLRFAIYAQDAKTIAKAPGIGIIALIPINQSAFALHNAEAKSASYSSPFFRRENPFRTNANQRRH